MRVVVVLAFVLCILGCEAPAPPAAAKPAEPPPIPELLRESWRAYVQRFIQEDGRVIDHSAEAITTSEGQAYAMMRAVWLNDRETFDKVHTWARNNLNSGVRGDNLWAWKWGQNSNGEWGVLDKAFASDADQDAALALILASLVWKDDRYLESARGLMQDLWLLGTVEVGRRWYLLAGDTLCEGEICRINTSYYAPYAYRVFARYDKTGNWARLVDTSYHLVDIVSDLTTTRLPPDWVLLNIRTGEFTPGTEKDSAFSYDAFRTFWRLALDKELFDESRAVRYFEKSLAWAATEWQDHGKLPAVISMNGMPAVDYESLEMLSGLIPAFRYKWPGIAAAAYRTVESSYLEGVWGEKDRYYLQNWAWFGTALYQNQLGPLELLKP